jgi:C_GCAxxG_C_C family probable redox protein
MKTNTEQAIDYFKSGFNCAQSVLSVSCEKYNLDLETARKITSGLGSGVRAGEICGVVSGAVIAIGLKYGQCSSDDLESKMNCYAKTEEFINAFRSRYGSIVCRDILGCDVSTVGGREQAIKDKLFTTICEQKVREAVELLEELGY